HHRRRVACLRPRDPPGQVPERADDVTLVEEVIAVHDPYRQDLSVRGNLAHDARDERGVTESRVELADQGVSRNRRVPFVPYYLPRPVAVVSRLLAFRTDGS